MRHRNESTFNNSSCEHIFSDPTRNKCTKIPQIHPYFSSSVRLPTCIVSWSLRPQYDDCQSSHQSAVYIASLLQNLENSAHPLADREQM